MTHRSSIHILAGTLAATLTASAAPQIESTPSAIYPEIIPFAVLDYDADGVDELIGLMRPDSAIVAYSVAADGSLAIEKRLADDGDGLVDATLADMDGDGLVDLVGVKPYASGGANIVIYYDRGGVRYESPEWLLLNLPDVSAFTTTDFDLDGDLDIVLYPASPSVNPLSSSSIVSGPISVSLNQGGGIFSIPADVLSFPETLRAAAPIELDQDGDLDFVALRDGSGAIVLTRRENSVLKIEAVLSSQVGYEDLEVGDVDGDGFDDVIAYRTSGTAGQADLDLYLGTAAGELGTRSALLIGTPDLEPDVSLADLDGDGHLDIAVAGSGTSATEHSVLILAGDGMGGFTQRPWSGSASGAAAERSLVGDFNGDGRDDLLSVATSAVAFGGGSIDLPLGIIRLGETGPSVEVALELGLAVTSSVAHHGDLDGDGVEDIVASTGSRLVWFRGLADASRFGAPVFLGEADEVVLVANLDGDPADELLVHTGGGVGFGMIDSLGGASFAPLTPINLGIPLLQGGLQVADIDGDGDLDIVGPQTNSNTLSWLSNLGALQFASPVAFSFQGGLTSFGHRLGDFNGDGTIDIVAYIFGVPSFGIVSQVWYEGLGGGVLGAQQSIGISTSEARVVDLQGDGYDDVLWWQPSGAHPAIFLTSGGPLGPLPSDGELLVTTSISQIPLGLADFDGDGRRDLISHTRTGEIFGYPRLPGTQLAFGQVPTILGEPVLNSAGLPVYNVRVDLVDLGGDGDVDLLVSSGQGGVFWHENLSRELVGTTYCGPGIANSTGSPGRMVAAGTSSALANELTLRALDLPQQSFGFFITSRTQVPARPVIGSAGQICLGGSVGRYVGPGQVQSSGVVGSFALGLDLTAMPTPLGFVGAQPGETWSFQAWHRDSSTSGPTSNFTDGLEVDFQ